MSFWGTLTGADQADRIEQANAAATGQVRKGYGQARRNINRGRTAANQGYSSGRNALTQGRNQALQQNEQGRTRALQQTGQGLNALTSGGDRAISSVQQGVAGANEQINPYAQQGGRANALYGNALGLNGAQAQQGFVDSFQSDPFRDFNENRANTELLRFYNSRGMADSGASRLAASRANLERGTQDYNAYLDRLSGQADRGFQAAGQMGQNALTGARDVARIHEGTGRDVANIYGQMAGIETGAANDAERLYSGTGTNLANNFVGQGNMQNQSFTNLAGLNTGQANTLAGQEINLANALNAADTAGVNNILSGLGGLGGLALQGFAPGAGGVSPFQNALTMWQG